MDPLQIHVNHDDLMFEPLSPPRVPRLDEPQQQQPQQQTQQQQQQTQQNQVQQHRLPTPQTTVTTTTQQYLGSNHTIVAQVILPHQETTMTTFVYMDMYAKTDDIPTKYVYLGQRHVQTPATRWWVDPDFIEKLISDGVVQVQQEFPYKHLKDTNTRIHFREPHVCYQTKTDGTVFKYTHPADHVTKTTAPDIGTTANGPQPFSRLTVYLTPLHVQIKPTTEDEDQRLVDNIMQAILHAKRKWTVFKRPAEMTQTSAPFRTPHHRPRRDDQRDVRFERQHQPDLRTQMRNPDRDRSPARQQQQHWNQKY